MADEPGYLRVSSTLRIPDGELVWRFSRSGGPGGQHVNTADTRAEVRFDVAGSPTLGPRQRARLQLVTAEGRAHLAVLESGQWHLEATYD
jgi:protein subunit release factor B